MNVKLVRLSDDNERIDRTVIKDLLWIEVTLSDKPVFRIKVDAGGLQVSSDEMLVINPISYNIILVNVEGDR